MLPLLGGKLVGMVRDDEKHSFMMYGNLPSGKQTVEWESISFVLLYDRLIIYYMLYHDFVIDYIRIIVYYSTS